ncbi:hypothetical protein MSG28_001000 [Choristoneura fumiferana]|uniref:Uncharacterized protein n=1 Tax=Choristoneura fumiferana TaxID=7141 RepID=A0ACC0K354_CHOFU|nr:hypothetical protein MSG28_001000 [Choristoneura fumiferana]
MEAEECQMDRLIVSDLDRLQLVSLENLCCKRLEGVRIIQQLACFNAASLNVCVSLWKWCPGTRTLCWVVPPAAALAVTAAYLLGLLNRYNELAQSKANDIINGLLLC